MVGEGMVARTGSSPAGARDGLSAAGYLTVTARALWQEHRALTLVAAAFIVAASLAGMLARWPGPVGFQDYASVLTYLTPLVLPPLAFVQLWRYRHRYHTSGSTLPWYAAWRAAAHDLWRRDLTLERALSYVAALLLTTLVLATFGGWKQAYPALAPFAWDGPFMRLDRALHFGRLPHEWLAPVLARPRLMWALDRLYIVSYFGVVALGWLVAAAAPPSALRRRFLLTNALAWVLLGALAATAFSSAGPWAYGAVAGTPDPYAGLMGWLQAIDAGGLHLKALAAQRILWEAHESGRVLTAAGISAMPSLHIAMVTLVALASWRLSPWLGALAGLYALLMLAGSVLTGMHYAVDGYAGIVLTAALWRLAGKLAR